MRLDLVARLRAADRTINALQEPGSTKTPSEDDSYPMPSFPVVGLAETASADLMEKTDRRMRGNPILTLVSAGRGPAGPVEVLEALLYIANPLNSPRCFAERAVSSFGSLGAVLSASVEELVETVGMDDHSAYVLKAIYTGMCSALREPLSERAIIGSYRDLCEYVSFTLKHQKIEMLRALYLDVKNGLILDELIYEGTIDHVPLYPREIVKRALSQGASAIILVHNHPSGDPTPSQKDITTGIAVRQALQTLGIALHDHIIVGRNSTVSMRQNGHL